MTEFLCLLASAWIKVEQLKPYHAHKEEMIKINKGKRFQQAVDSVEDYLKKSKGKEQVRFGGWCTPLSTQNVFERLKFGNLVHNEENLLHVLH